MLAFLSLVALAILIGLGLFITVTFHELGHAFAALLLTDDEVTVHVGSFGNPYNSFNVKIGRIDFYCTKNPLLWYKGCCLCSDDYMSLNERIWLVAAGPIASVLETVLTWYLIGSLQDNDFLRILFGSILVMSLGATAYSLIPNPSPRYTSSGYAIYSDSYEIIRLLRIKRRGY